VSFEEYLTEFAGLPVADFPVVSADSARLGEPQAWAWRLRVDTRWDGHDLSAGDGFAARFAAFVEQVDAARVRALIIGPSELYGFGSSEPVRLLAEHAAEFPSLRAIFFADVIREDSDVAYIEHSDLMPILESFALLEAFHVRGSANFHLEQPPVRAFKHEALRTLVFESGGLNPRVFRAVGESEIPELEHLEFYFGEEEYGGGAGVDDIAWLLSGEKFPKLRHLGLRDAPNQDEIAAALAHAPIVARLEELDLSLGTLGDEGAAALLAGQPLTHLRKLDLHHHFMSSAMTQRLHEALPDVELNLDEQNEPDSWGGESHRYIAVSE
jgi:catechol 2,3-dioxygenase-like lactoylglutathione lyase family enzyme